jgi:hypothetical protein
VESSAVTIQADSHIPSGHTLTTCPAAKTVKGFAEWTYPDIAFVVGEVNGVGIGTALASGGDGCGLAGECGGHGRCIILSTESLPLLSNNHNM